MTWVDPPEDHDPWSLPSFIESELLFSEDDYLSLTEVRGLYPSGLQPTDQTISFARAEIERREREWGEHYPFLVDGRGVLLVGGPGAVLYGILLLLSLKGMPLRTAEGLARSGPLFDAVAREAFAAHLNADCLVFAWPPRAGRPSTFPQAVQWAADRMGLRLRGESDQLPTHLRDAGVDLVAWKPFPDGRPGFATYLIQNTVQWQFRKKPRDVDPDRWFSWITCSTPPSVGFAVPFAIPDDDPWWDDISSGTAVVMDRGRLMYSVSGSDPRIWTEWAALETFVEREIAAVRQGARSEAAAPAVERPRRTRKST